MTLACGRLQNGELFSRLACCAPARSVGWYAYWRLSAADEVAVRIAACQASSRDFAGIVPAAGGSLPPPDPC
jgi:hypothetical protein